MTIRIEQNEEDKWTFPAVRGFIKPLPDSILNGMANLSISDRVTTDLKEVGQFRARPLAPVTLSPMTFPHVVEIKKETNFITHMLLPPEPTVISKEATLVLSETVLRGTAKVIEKVNHLIAELPVVGEVVKFSGFVVHLAMPKNLAQEVDHTVNRVSGLTGISKPSIAYMGTLASLSRLPGVKITPIQNMNGRCVVKVERAFETLFKKTQSLAETNAELAGYQLLRGIKNIESEVRLPSILKVAKLKDSINYVTVFRAVEGETLSNLFVNAAMTGRAEVVAQAAYLMGRGHGFMHHGSRIKDHFVPQSIVDLFIHQAESGRCNLPSSFHLNKTTLEGIFRGFKEEAAIVHQDLHGGNVIYKSGEKIGIIDPSRVSRFFNEGKPTGSPAVDHYSTLKFMEIVAVDSFVPKEMIKDIQRAYVEGYRASNPVPFSKNNEIFALYYTEVLNATRGCFALNSRVVKKHAKDFREMFE